MCREVSPAESSIIRRAGRLLRRATITLVWPYSQARCRAVLLLRGLATATAPCDRQYTTIARWPCLAALQGQECEG